MFEFDFSDKLRFKLRKLEKKDPKQLSAVKKKVRQIIALNAEDLENRFKILKHGMFGCRRVQLQKSFVLTFKVHRDSNFILFLDYDHHDKIYKR